MKKVIFSLSLITLFPIFAGKVYATKAEFPSCLVPAGKIIADHTTGEHGIVGYGSKIGSDKVYSLDNTNVLQCFCGDNGSGIQTNWKNASELSEDEIKIYKNDGWIYVPDGSAWGLSDNSYIAKNLDYTCKSSTTGGGQGQEPNNPNDGKSDGAGSIVQAATGNSSSNGSLASTGNISFIISTFSVGFLLTILGSLLARRSN